MRISTPQVYLTHQLWMPIAVGALLLTVRASRIFYDILPEGGTVDLVYEICIENTEAGIIDYHLDIRRK